jgi:hypothetical protein
VIADCASGVRASGHARLHPRTPKIGFFHEKLNKLLEGVF